MDIEFVIFKEVSEFTLFGEKFSLEMRRNHSIFKELWDYDSEKNVFISKGWDEKFEIYPAELKAAGITPRIVLWEGGGGYTNTGSAGVICGCSGEKLKPVYIRTRGHLACSDHAKFVVWPGHANVEVSASQWRGDFGISIKKYALSEDYIPEVITLWEAGGFGKRELHEVLPEKFDCFFEAVKAAMSKATCYHCRSPHYILWGDEDEK